MDAVLHDASPLIDVFVFEKAGRRELVLINKTPESFQCSLPEGMAAASMLRLHAPAVDAKEGVQISILRDAARKVAIAPSYTATVYRLASRST